MAAPLLLRCLHCDRVLAVLPGELPAFCVLCGRDAFWRSGQHEDDRAATLVTAIAERNARLTVMLRRLAARWHAIAPGHAYSVEWIHCQHVECVTVALLLEQS